MSLISHRSLNCCWQNIRSSEHKKITIGRGGGVTNILLAVIKASCLTSIKALVSDIEKELVDILQWKDFFNQKHQPICNLLKKNHLYLWSILFLSVFPSDKGVEMECHLQTHYWKLSFKLLRLVQTLRFIKQEDY